jgi:hypothetical protein
MSRATQLLSLALILAHGGSSAQRQAGAGEQLNHLVGEIQASRIGDTVILQIRPSSVFRTSVTPELLARWYDYRTVIHKGDPRMGMLASVLKTAHVRGGGQTPDLRTGLIFYPIDTGLQPVALYFDKAGEHGLMSNAPVLFKGDLLEKVRAVLSLPF